MPTPSEERRSRLRRLRTLARLRRRIGWAWALLPVAFIVAIDLLTRGHRIMQMPSKYLASYAFAVVESGLLWGLLLWASAARRGISRYFASGTFAILLTVAAGVQVYFHSQYATYLNLDATLFGTDVAASAMGQLGADVANFAKTMAIPLVFSIAALYGGRAVIRPHRRTARIARFAAPIAVVAVFLIPCSYRSVQASTPDVIYFHALGGLVKELSSGERTTAQIRPGLRNPPKLPSLLASPKRPRNVVLVLTESVRADAHCSQPTEDCAISPRTNLALPERTPLLQLRSNASTTAIELAVLWSGLEPIESRERLHSAPLLFDYAKAAGLESAYWTSHHMMFANSRLFVQDLPTRFRCGATDLDPLADMDLGARDELVVERAKAEILKLKEPFFATVHVGNTHVPYRVDPNDSPFQPSENSKAEEDNEKYQNYYRNAVYLQDKSVADFVRFVRASDISERTVLIFTSDHGEAFREHNQLGHTSSILEQEIHVPGWVDAPPHTLDDEERSALLSRISAPTFHTDMTPTVLDLLGLWDSPDIADWKKAMPGQSWLRPRDPQIEARPLAMTNCSGVWGCAFRNWGVMRGTMKLSGREWDTDWSCFDVSKDPSEKNDLGKDGCKDLIPFATKVFGGSPGAP